MLMAVFAPHYFLHLHRILSTMQKFIRLFLLLLSLTPGVSAQLLPPIGLNQLPADTASICPIPWYLGSFYASGLSEGNAAHDFKLYNLSGDSLVLSQKLALGKPVLLVAGSLTCPVFMNKLSTINQVISTYGNQIQVFVIYTLEAHPTDTSVYFGYVNVGTANQSAGILFPQPTTYAGRKMMVDTLSFWGSCNAPIFIDGPCNEWWSTFGPAPNNAYLIDTNGIISAKHGWFHRNDDQIFCDIDSLLGSSSGLCNSSSNPGQFHLQVLNQSVSGSAGSILYDYANLINTGNDPVTLGIKKIQQNLPANWQTAFCADVCYSPSDDSITLILAPQDTLLFSLDFITSSIPDSGSVKVGFRNTNDFSNSFQMNFKATTFPTNALESNHPEWQVYPNPTSGILRIDGEESDLQVQLYTIRGELLNSTLTNHTLDLNHLPNGLYILHIISGKNHSIKKIIKE